MHLPLSRLLRRDLVFAIYLVLIFVMGGGSRADIVSLVILRPLGAVAAVWFALTLQREDWQRIRIPLILLCSAIVLTGLQLVPLPPVLWHSLPGRSLLVREDHLVGFGDIWRPLSLNPDGTRNALYSLLVPLSVLFGLAGLDGLGRRFVPKVLLALVAISVLLSVLQVAGGQRSVFYLYSVTNRGMMVGLFANRNHNALLMACALPLLALLGRKWVQSPDGLRSPKVMIGLVAAVAVLPLLGAVGSRAALAAGVPAFAISAHLLLRENEKINKLIGRHRTVIAAIGLAVLAATVLVVIMFGSAAQRIGSMDVSEIRFKIWRATWGLIARYFPVGSGFGSFDTVYRAQEPLTTIGPSYINHAHNDFLELILEGGVLALLMLSIGIILFALRTTKLMNARGQSKSLALAGGGIIVVLLIGSTTDYPLRVPSLMAMMAIASVWLWGVDLRTRAPWR